MKFRASTWLPVVACIQFALGSMFLGVSLLTLLFGAGTFILSYLMPEPLVARVLGILSGGIGVLALVASLVLLFAGVGTILRRPWGRWVGIVLGVGAAFSGAKFCWDGMAAPAVFYFAYAVLTLVPLVTPSCAAEFRSAPTRLPH